MSDELNQALSAAEETHAEAIDAVEQAREVLGRHEASVAEIEDELSDVQARVLEIQTSEGGDEELPELDERERGLEARLRQLRRRTPGLEANVAAAEERAAEARRDMLMARQATYRRDAWALGETIRHALRSIVDEIADLKALDKADEDARRSVNQGLGYPGPKPPYVVYAAGLTDRFWKNLLVPLEDELALMERTHAELGGEENAA